MSDQYLEPRPAALKKIKHVVVLMLENRSFDNLLGWLYDDEDPPRDQEFEGLSWDLWNPLQNVDTDGIPFVEKVGIRKNGRDFHIGRKKVKGKENFRLPDPDPGEGFRDTNHQLFEYYEVGNIYPPAPTNMGFVNNYQNAMLYGTYSFQDAPTDPREIMTCFTPEQVPVLGTLARQFAVCDQWHCSVPSQTLPNRDFIHAASSNGNVNNKPNDTCDARTIFNQIQDAIDQDGRDDLSWLVYSGTQKGQPFSLTRTIMTALAPHEFDHNFRMIGEFYKDAESGDLPSYCFLEPQFSGSGQNDQHPPADIRPGDKLVADVYNALKDSPAWEQTLLVITYDEHGGCYDHDAPPSGAATPDKQSDPGQWDFRFNRFGIRVPAVVVSPYIQAGTVARPAGWTPYDHTSVIKTVQETFGLEGNLTERDKAAPDLSGILTLDTPRTDKPEVQPLAWEEDPAAKPHVNDLHRLSAEILARLTGQAHPSDEEIHEFIHDAYAKYFSEGGHRGTADQAAQKSGAAAAH